jgi:hypothetical protein
MGSTADTFVFIRFMGSNICQKSFGSAFCENQQIKEALNNVFAMLVCFLRASSLSLTTTRSEEN